MANFIKVWAVLRYECCPALMIAITLPLGCKRHFNFSGLNPRTLTEEQSKKHPILLLHGACHNQGVWLYLAKKLKSANLGPIFTVNTSCFPAANIKKSFDVIDKKIAEIKHLYLAWSAKPVFVDILGYSAGAMFAYFVSLDQQSWSYDAFGFPTLSTSFPQISNPTIHRVICVGSRVSPLMPNMYEIVGADDILIPPFLEEKLEGTGKQIVVECGHLNLVRNPIVHQHISRIFSDDEAKIQEQDFKQENEIEPTQPKKGCFNRFFKRRENHSPPIASHEPTPSEKYVRSCVIL